MKSKIRHILVFLAVSSVFFSCMDEDFTTNPAHKLAFSTEELTFDTIFTTIGSTTQTLMVYNHHNRPLRIDRIELSQNSNFRINVSGFSANSFSDVEIRARDSMFVFVEVTVNPNDENTPFLITDSIVFYTNSNVQRVKLTAYGQNAVILRSEVISENTTFTDEKPYLIFGTLVVEENASLTINSNSRLYFNHNSGIKALGNLQINGTLEEPVIMRGSRLDNFLGDYNFDYLPGQWNGIELLGNGRNYSINFANIRNARTGIRVENATLSIENSTIHNFDGIAIDARNSEVLIANSLIANSREHCLRLVGGNHRIVQSTLANYYFNMSANRGRAGSPMILLSNFAYNDENIRETFDLNVEFTNSIIFGSVTEEIRMTKDSLAVFNYSFSHSLIRSRNAENFNENSINEVIWNEDPRFVSTRHPFDFRLLADSPALEAGNPNVILEFPHDLLGNLRTGNTLGAYEFVEEEE